jgi:hypothetical protein
MQLVEQRSSLVRLISILKARDAPIDARLQTFEIGAQGIMIADEFSGAKSPAGFAPGSPRRDA